MIYQHASRERDRVIAETLNKFIEEASNESPDNADAS